MGDMTITIFGHVDEDNWSAELWWKDKNWGVVVFDDESASFLLTVYSPGGHQGYQFPLADALVALERAKERLTKMGYGVLK